MRVFLVSTTTDPQAGESVQFVTSTRELAIERVEELKSKGCRGLEVMEFEVDSTDRGEV